MNKNKKEILLLPCYEHDVREYVKRCNAHISLTPVYKLTPEEEKEFQEEENKINKLFVPGGRKLLNNQEHIFVEALADMDVPDDETKFKSYMTKYFKQSPSAERSIYA